MKRKLGDKLLLVLTGLAIFAIGIPLYLFVEKRFSKGWTDFIMMSIGYSIALQYMPFTSARLRRIPKFKIILFQTVMAVITIGFVVIKRKTIRDAK